MLLNKCNLKVWKNLLKQDMNNNNYCSDSESDSREYYNEEEKEFILINKIISII